MNDKKIETKEEFEKLIKTLCFFNEISVSELARRFGTSPQNFNARLKVFCSHFLDLQKIADLLGYEIKWVKKD